MSLRACCKEAQSFDVLYLSQDVLIFDDVFIGGQKDVKLSTAKLRHKASAQSRSALKYKTIQSQPARNDQIPQKQQL